MVVPDLDPCDIHTAQDVSLTDPRIFDIDGCKLYTTFLEGVGLVWPEKPERRDAVIGNFTGHRSISVEDHSVQEVASQASTAAATSLSPRRWQQAYDQQSGYYYYYCEATQETQWEAPQEGFQPLDWNPPAPSPESLIDVTSNPFLEAVKSYRIHHSEAGNSDEGIREASSSSQLQDESTVVVCHKDTGREVEPGTVQSTEEISNNAIHCSIRQSASDNSLPTVSSNGEVEQTDVPPGTVIESLAPPDRGGQCRPLSDDASGRVGISLRSEHNTEEGVCAPQSSQELQEEQVSQPGGNVSLPTPHPEPKKKKTKKKKPGSKRNRQQGGPGGRPWWLPEGVPGKAQKYWLQRYSLFSRYDDGIQLDLEGWFSVTPEVVAAHQARVAPESGIALDPFAGTGGNVVALAQRCRHVVAVELHPTRATLLQHNARIYGVEDHVDIVAGDFFNLARGLKADFVFFSPPWGGPEYSNMEVYDLEDMGGLGLSLNSLLSLAFDEVGASGVQAFLPRNADLRQAASAAQGRPCLAERIVLNGYVKGITMHYGAAATRWLELSKSESKGMEANTDLVDEKPDQHSTDA